MKVVSYVALVLLPTALIVIFFAWLTKPMITNYVETGTSVVASGSPEGKILVEADSEVCAQGVSEKGPFVVDTPSGKFFSSQVIGHDGYFYGYGCFQPGTWTITEGAVTATLTNPKWVRATSIESPRVKNVFKYFSLMVGIATFIVFNVTFFLTLGAKAKKN